ncbi:MAG: hypothetical protein PVJ72_19255 [Gammaproteobacteria bacterium]
MAVNQAHPLNEANEYCMNLACRHYEIFPVHHSLLHDLPTAIKIKAQMNTKAVSWFMYKQFDV